MTLAARLTLLALGAALLGFTWWQRRDPLDLGVVAAGLLGLALLMPPVLRGDARGGLAPRVLVALLGGAAVFGVRDPGSALGFAAVLLGTQLLLRRLVGPR
ncbi:hypothetical protein [Deinococcus budaensis]|uniref:Uncharacterized protein n=1 Tax=Deinococcus budaensis TaxID=1665626 RepID=A0A7W8GFW4_9DEIO|nr:hypothetical protein [Deinococcus budaensis]MBB5234840.1 hypothetical protein [Deinococcus budaensis]